MRSGHTGPRESPEAATGCHTQGTGPVCCPHTARQDASWEQRLYEKEGNNANGSTCRGGWFWLKPWDHPLCAVLTGRHVIHLLPPGSHSKVRPSDRLYGTVIRQGNNSSKAVVFPCSPRQQLCLSPSSGCNNVRNVSEEIVFLSIRSFAAPHSAHPSVAVSDQRVTGTVGWSFQLSGPQPPDLRSRDRNGANITGEAWALSTLPLRRGW